MTVGKSENRGGFLLFSFKLQLNSSVESTIVKYLSYSIHTGLFSILFDFSFSIMYHRVECNVSSCHCSCLPAMWQSMTECHIK